MRCAGIVIWLAAALLLSSCSTLPAPGRTTKSERLDQRHAYVGKATARLDQLDRQITALADRAGKAEGKAKADLEARIAQLRNKESAARRQVAGVAAASESAWLNLRSAANAAIEDLRKTYERTASQMKDAGN